MNEAYEISPDDQQAVTEALARVATGARVRLVRDGEHIGDIVPPTRPVPDDCELTRDQLDELEARAASEPAELTSLLDELAGRHGAPTLDHYRAVYASLRRPWPGADFIHRHHPVADAS